MRALTLLVAALVLSSHAAAQVVAIHFVDEKAARKYRKHTTVWGGEPVLLAEPVPGGGIRIDRDASGTRVNYRAGGRNEVFVLDPKDPTEVPYELRDGEPVPRSKRDVVDVPGKVIRRISVPLPTETIATIAREYRLRRERIDALRDERDAHEKGSAAWFDAHRRMLGGLERLASWLASMSFADAAEDVEKEHAKEARGVSEEAFRVRAERALASPEEVEVHPELEALVGDVGFTAHESEHVRIVALEAIPAARVRELLVLAERVVDGFRAQFVDPYASEAFADRIPDEPFLEIYFGPEDPDLHQRVLEAFYGRTVQRPERLREMLGSRHVLTNMPRLLDAWRYDGTNDLEGIVVHGLGHALAAYHFGGGPTLDQPWMEEGLGYYLSFEFLGRNSVVCKEFREGAYVRDPGAEGRKEVEVGYRDRLTEAALERGPRLERLVLLTLHEMEDADLAKSWSFVEYVARRAGAEGQRWMRAAGEASRSRGTFLQELRAATEELFEVPAGTDPLQVLEERWRRYAETEQRAG